MFSSLIIAYLFLGGTGAACLLASSVIGLLCPDEAYAPVLLREYRCLLMPAQLAGMAALLLGIFFLAADLGRLDRILLMFSGGRASFMLLGTSALIITCLDGIFLSSVYATHTMRLPMRFVRIGQVLLIASAAICMVYTGLMLAQMDSVPLWHSPWLVALFTASSASCGIVLAATCIHITIARDCFQHVLDVLAGVDCTAIVLEACTVVLLLAQLQDTSFASDTGTFASAQASLSALLSGAYAPVFWGLFVLMGLIAPLVINALFYVTKTPRRYTALLSAGAVLVGGAALRWCIVSAGMHPLLMC